MEFLLTMVGNKLRGLKVLIADYYSGNCRLIKIILGIPGIESIGVASVSEAIAIYKSLQPDILVVDIDMLEKDGFSFLRRVRTLSPEKGGQVLAIALTAYSSEEVESEAIIAGFQGLISKPFDVDELSVFLTKFLRTSNIYRFDK